MRIFTFLIISVCLSVMAVGQSFQGKVVMTHTLKPNASQTFHINGDQAAIMLKGPGIYPGMKNIVNSSNGDYYTIAPVNGKIRVSKINLSDPVFSSAYVASQPEVKVIKTEETKNIDGYSCVKYIAETKEGMNELWVTQDLKEIDLAAFMTPKDLVREGKFFNLKEVDGFVMEIHGIAPRTNQAYVIKNQVEKVNIDISTFDIPSGDNVIDVNKLNKKIKAAQGNPQELKQLKQDLKDIHKN